MATPDKNAGVGKLAGRIATWPALSLLGLVLPLVFLTQVEDFLYYFRSAELLPAYGTAWLFLAVLLVLPTAALWLWLRTTRTVPLSATRMALGRAAVVVATICAAAAVLYSVLAW